MVSYSRWIGFITVWMVTLAAPSWAESYPTKPIRIIVPVPPGGANDVLARLMAQRLSQSLGQNVIVDNKPGASTAIGIDMLAKSVPDGYTIAVAPDQSLSINPVLNPKLPYRSSEIKGISLLARLPLVLVVNPAKVQARTITELIAAANKNPGLISYASSGAGGPQHMAAELFAYMTRTSFSHVPYKGSAPAINDLLAGVVDIFFGPLNSALPHIKSGKLIALGSTSPRRLDILPDVPAIAETVTNFESETWVAMVAPAKVPVSIINKLNAELSYALSKKDLRDQLSAQGIFAEVSSPAQLDAMIAADQQRWLKVIRTANIKPE